MCSIYASVFSFCGFSVYVRVYCILWLHVCDTMSQYVMYMCLHVYVQCSTKLKKYLLLVCIHVVESALMHFFVSEWNNVAKCTQFSQGTTVKKASYSWLSGEERLLLFPTPPPPYLPLTLSGGHSVCNTHCGPDSVGYCTADCSHEFDRHLSCKICPIVDAHRHVCVSVYCSVCFLLS